MAQSPNLLYTPSLPGHSALDAILKRSIKSVELDDDDDDDDDEYFRLQNEDNFPETPSPCTRKAGRRVQKNPCRSTTHHSQFIQDLIRKNNSPKFDALVQRLPGSPLAGKSEQERLEQVDSSDNSEHEAEDTHNQQECEQEQPPNSSSEAPTPDDSSSQNPPEEQSTLSPIFISKPQTIRDIFVDMRDILTKFYNDDEPGHAYILFDQLGRSPFFKIGKTINPKSRKGVHLRNCQLEGWGSRHRPAVPMDKPLRLERLAQAELKNLKCDPNCRCGVDHVEYYWGSRTVGLEALDFWSGWLQNHQPYDGDGNLTDFWIDRLNIFQDRIPDYFKCAGSQCAEQDEDTPACQACLRAGWEKWAEPTPGDELDYACRADLLPECLGLLIQYLSTFSFINNFFLIAVANLIVQVLSLLRWISDPNVFLCAIPFRLLGFWVEPKIRLPDSAVCCLLSVVDVTLFAVCVYNRFHQGRGGSAMGSPKKVRRGKRVSIGETTLQVNGPAQEVGSSSISSNTDPRNRSVTSRATGRRKTR